jgi:tetratricopeptide (TPR) repeat protein
MKQAGKWVSLFLVFLAVAGALAGCGEPKMTADEHFQKGNEYAGTGDFENAITEYEAVLELEPDNVSAMTNLGVAYYNTGQLDQAIAQYQNALGLAPEDADIHSNLAAAYVQTNQLDKAQSEYQRAVELKADLAEAWFGLGVVYIQLGQNDQAINAFEKFVEYDKGTDKMATDQAQQYLQQLKGQ